MTNITKYWLLLESMHFATINDTKEHGDAQYLKESSLANDMQRLSHNVREFRKYIKLPMKDLVRQLLEDLNLKHMMGEAVELGQEGDLATLYSFYGIYMIKEIANNVNFISNATEDLVAERHKCLFIACIQDIAQFSLQQHLHPNFYKGRPVLFSRPHDKKTSFKNLEIYVGGFTHVLFIKPLHIGKSLDEPILQYMAGIFSLLMACEDKEYVMADQEIINKTACLQRVWLSLPKSLYFRNLMLMKNNNILSSSGQKILQRQLLIRLWSPGGFNALVFALAECKKEEHSLEELISRLVAQPAYSAKAQKSLIGQILNFSRACVDNQELLQSMGVGLLSLRRLYDLNDENKTFVEGWLQSQLHILIQPDCEKDFTVMDWCNFQHLISLLFHLFCTSTVECLPSNLLTSYLNLILNIFYHVQQHNNTQLLQGHLKALILKCLHNQNAKDLHNIIEAFALQRTDFKEWVALHDCICFDENPLNSQELRIILTSEGPHLWDPLPALVMILKSSTFNLLSFNIFLILFRLLPKLIKEDEEEKKISENMELLQPEDLHQRILREVNTTYARRLHIIKALESLVQHQPMKCMINENSNELLRCLADILINFSELNKHLSEINESTLMIALILVREIMQISTTRTDDFQTVLSKPLHNLYENIDQQSLKYQILSVLHLLQGRNDLNVRYDPLKDQFEEARDLVEAKEPYLQVEGIEKLIKLINCRDTYTVSNAHAIAAMALNTLKSPESYTFLNCVRLFTALVHIMEFEILDLLGDEYVADSSTLDYRLVVGEVILKIGRELGPLCYKYKTILLNCFMTGCRSQLGEFRLSAFSNLAQLCRILSYQVYQYFQELLQLIDCELTSGKYLPAKRAAVMVLSDLLEGMDNLFDYEEMLLPIYRLLKCLAYSKQSDEQIRIHATNGLKNLSEKCTKLVESITASCLEKEIKILGVKDSYKRDLKNHILEMN
uniref:RNA polymerase II assembly factor Rtp1 C-terminal domain-containing protein n=1 Tax=Glossina morsitans morsitans TaxID=37546 RepID=A0A1B0G3T9_GLOMM